MLFQTSTCSQWAPKSPLPAFPDLFLPAKGRRVARMMHQRLRKTLLTPSPMGIPNDRPHLLSISYQVEVGGVQFMEKFGWKNGGHLKCEKKNIFFSEEEGQAVTDTDPIIGEGKSALRRCNLLLKIYLFLELRMPSMFTLGWFSCAPVIVIIIIIIIIIIITINYVILLSRLQSPTRICLRKETKESFSVGKSVRSKSEDPWNHLFLKSSNQGCWPMESCQHRYAARITLGRWQGDAEFVTRWLDFS